MEEFLRTPLYDWHVRAGAKTAPFAGWEMPINYPEGILAEHNHTRNGAAVFDICHMGEFRVKGPGSAAALDKILARTVIDQKNGVSRYNFILTERGTVIDDLIVFRISEEEFYIVVNAGTRKGDAEHFRKNLPAGIIFTDESDATGKIDLQGPLSADVLIALGLKKEELPAYFNFNFKEIKGIPCLLSRTGYTGELGYELYTETGRTLELWELLLSQNGVKPVGLGARDTLRLEMAYPLYGHELNLDTTPVEAGFGEMIKISAPRDFIGSAALRSVPPAKKLHGIELDGRRAAREGNIVKINGAEAGKVSSGAFSPTLGRAVAMAYISAAVTAAPGDSVEVEVGRAAIPGKIVALPFVKTGTARKKL
jgi:aminomethyltransferase